VGIGEQMAGKKLFQRITEGEQGTYDIGLNIWWGEPQSPGE